MAIIPNQHNLEFKENGPETQKIHCPKCHDTRRNKRDKSLSINTRARVFKCHHCEWADRIDGWKDEETYVMPQRSGWSNFKEPVQLFLAGRKLSLPIIQKNKIIQRSFNVEIEGVWKEQLFLGFPYFKMGVQEPVNVKWRCVEAKEFRQEKGAMHILYNLPLWATEKELIICEGEIDVMSWNECGIWNATTLSDGAINEKDKSVEGKLKSLYNSWQYLQNKTRFYLCLDNDAPGRRLQEVLQHRLDQERCYLIKLPADCKDPNECLQKYGPEKLIECKSKAQPVPTSGIIYVNDEAESMIDEFINGIKMGDLTHMGDLDNIFRWKPGSINLWTGYMNTGKTIFFLQCALVKSILDGWKWCVFSPENYPAKDFYNDLIEMYVGKNVSHQYGNKMTLAEYQAALEFINKHFIFVYPDDQHTIQRLHELFEKVILKHGINGVLVDPYNQVEKSFPGVRSDEEISEFGLIVKRFAVKHNLVYNIAIHPKNPLPPKGKEPLPVVQEFLLNGGAMWGNKCDHLLSIYRPNWHLDRKNPAMEVHQFKVKRKRTGGNYGHVEFIWDYKKSRYTDSTGKYFCDPNRKLDYDASREIGEAPKLFAEEPQFIIPNGKKNFALDDLKEGEEYF